MGALFIGVVMAFPNGLAGLYETYLEPRVKLLYEMLLKKLKPYVQRKSSAQPGPRESDETKSGDSDDIIYSKSA
jgi:urea transport system permease protein